MQAVCSSRNAALLQLTLRIVRKLLWMLLVLWGITLISFWVIHLAPGSPTDMETTLNPLAGEAARQRLEALYGLDKPLHVQYLDWLSRLVRLDFGLSMSADGRPVLDKIMERLPLTVGMNVISLILTLVIAIPIGILSACRQNSLLDRGVTVFVYLGFAMPSFWLALLLMLFFGIHLQWLPISGLTSMNFDSLGPVDKVLDLARHLALPILVYTIISSFMVPWTDFVMAKMILNSGVSADWTVAIGLYNMLQKTLINNYFALFCAGGVLVSVPISILFIIMQKFYVEGITAGADKG